MKPNPLTKKQFAAQLAAVVKAAVASASKGATVKVTVKIGRPHEVHIEVGAVVSKRAAVLALLRDGPHLTRELVRAWPVGVFTAMESAGRPRLLETGRIALDLRIVGVPITEE